MKYQDHQLLEEAYDKVLLKEGRDDEVGLSDSEYYGARDEESYDAAHDRGDEGSSNDSFGDRVEVEFSFGDIDFFAAADLYGSVEYIDDSFDHEFGTEEGHHLEKKVEGIENLEIFYYKGGKHFPLTPETFGLDKYKELRKIAEETLTDKVERE